MTSHYYFRQLFDGQEWLENVTIECDSGVIRSLSTSQELPAGVDVIERAAKGFIDIQVNGGGGVMFNFDRSVEALETIFKAHSKFGTTAIMPTLISDDIGVLEEAAEAIAQAIRVKTPGILGIHFEGPHLANAKKGTHAADKLRLISEREWAVYERQDIGVKMVTLAPEVVALADIERLSRAGVRVFIGHSNANYTQASDALNYGAIGFTHLYNAMSQLTSREPGVVGAALNDQESWCGIINDGHHVADESLQIALKLKPIGKVLLVTDAMALLGTDDDSFEFFDRVVYRHGTKLVSSTGELAGAHLDMHTAVQRTHHSLNVPFDEAMRMASVYPAQCLGLTREERLGPESRAAWIELDAQNEIIKTVVLGG